MYETNTREICFASSLRGILVTEGSSYRGLTVVVSSSSLFSMIVVTSHIYLRRQQERGLMQKARRLMNENSVSFQMFLILLSYINTWFRKPNFCVQTMSEQYSEVCFGFFCTGEHAQKPKCEKKKLHKALRSVQFLASFISFYFEILSYLAYGEKIIRLTSKISVKLDEKSASDF